MLQNIALSQPISVMPASTRGASVVRLMPQAGHATACSSCCLKSVCLPCDLGRPELDRFDEIAIAKRRVPRGASLYHNGDRFDSLYAVRSGAFKTVGFSRHGDEKITGFHLPGELLGWMRSVTSATATARWRWRTARCASSPSRRSREWRCPCRRCSTGCCG